MNSPTTQSYTVPTGYPLYRHFRNRHIGAGLHKQSLFKAHPLPAPGSDVHISEGCADYFQHRKPDDKGIDAQSESISQKRGKIRRIEEHSKILEAYPFAAKNPLCYSIILKSHKNSAHRRVLKYEQPCQWDYQQQVQPSFPGDKLRRFSPKVRRDSRVC